MRIKDYEDKKREIKSHFKEYLKLKGRTVDGKMLQCPDSSAHEHGDSDPSASFFPDDDHYFCHRCSISGDIFQYVALHEGKPLEGEGFIRDNFIYLADMFNVKYEHEEMSADEKENIEVGKAYEKAIEILKKGVISEKAKTYLKIRGWEEIAGEFELGFCSYDKFIVMIEKDFSKPILIKGKLYHKELFDDRLIIPIRDAWGRAVGFASRTFDQKPKYVNSKTSQMYDKSATLFNLHKVSEQWVYVVEGYADVFTMHKVGIKNAIGMGGCILQAKQYETLVRKKIRKAVICPHSDIAGRDGVWKTISRIGQSSEVAIFIKEIDNGTKDSDEYIIKEGKEKFLTLPEITIFEWMILRYKEAAADQKEKCYNQLIECSVSEQNLISRERMADRLAEVFGIRREAVIKEIERLERIKSGRYNITVAEVVKEEGELSHAIDVFEEKAWNRTGIRTGYDFGYEVMNDKLDGLQNCLYLIAGRAGYGKTAIILNLAYNVLKENDNVACLIFSVDDNMWKILPRLISIESELPIAYGVNPKFKIEGLNAPEERKKQIYDKRQKAVDRIRELSSRLFIRDANYGRTIEKLERLIQVAKAATDKNLIVFADNFHKIGFEKDFAERRDRYSQMSEEMKRIVNVYNVPMIVVAELKKHNTARPSPDDIKESIDISYDADVLMLIHNQVKYDEENNRYSTQEGLYHLTDDGIKLPILEAHIPKTKTSDFSGTIFFRFYPYNSRVEECTIDEVNAARKALMKCT